MVHTVCQVIWETRNNYTAPTDTTVQTTCPEHHEHFLATGGGGKQGKVTTPPVLPSISQVALTAANTAAIAAANNLFPIVEVNNSTLNSSPADSTLTGVNNQVPTLPPVFEASPDDIAPDDADFDVSDFFDANDDAIKEFGGARNEHAGSGTTSTDNTNNDDDDNDNQDDDRDGGDSDDEGEVAADHVIALARRILNDDEGCKEVTVADAERIVLSHHDNNEEVEIDDEVGEPTSLEPIDATTRVLVGSPAGWFPPVPPPTFAGYVQKHDAPAEEAIDNPGGWSMFTFTATFDKKNKYQYHSTPTGARVVPKDGNGKRVVDGWEFNYKDWKGDEKVKETYARSGAAFGNLKPASRMGCLDVDILKKHGLTAERVCNDPMFFYQLLFPICAPQDSGIDDDHRMPYFSNTTVFTNMYAFSKGAGTGYGHDFTPVSISELVQWTAIPIRNGALDGRPSTLKHRWKNTNGARYDPVLAKSMTYQRWRQIKRYFKLSMGLMETKRGSIGYDPCAKYDYIWKCLIHNMNYVTDEADLDCTIDETTWGFSGYSAEAGGRLINKPVSKGECTWSL